MSPRRLTLVLFALLASLAQADIRYLVQPLPDLNRLKVQMKFDAKAGPLELQMPNWAPGAYILGVPARNVADLKATDKGGAALAVEKTNDNTWKTTGGPGLTVEYTVPCNLTVGAMHYSGPSAYLYVVGRKEEKCRLSIALPANWKLAVGLEPEKGSLTEFTAPDYDVLADNPVSMGELILATYEVQGKPHTLALRGVGKERADKDQMVKLCKHISESQSDFFGGLPYNRYVWHLSIGLGGGGGGLEHLTSTAISTGPAVTVGTAGLFAHEYFHLWNVKRIRSKPLGPFDYTALPKTGALYWLEGTTDYYASLLLLRYGWTKEEDFFRDILSNTNTVRSNPARLEVSPFEASMRVGETNNGRGNSNGYRISYYNLGWLVGLVLDIELRALTNGRRSLDDVERALWQMCRNNKPGFEEDEIRKQCVRFGGAPMGEFFDRVVMKPGELPIEVQLGKVGLKMQMEQEPYVDAGFDIAPVFQSQLVRIARVRNDVPGILADDILLAVGGTEIRGATLGDVMGVANQAIRALKADQPVTLKIRRAGDEKEFSITPKPASRPRWKVSEDPAASDAMKKLRDGWFYAGKKKKEPS